MKYKKKKKKEQKRKERGKKISKKIQEKKETRREANIYSTRIWDWAARKYSRARLPPARRASRASCSGPDVRILWFAPRE